MCQSSRRDGKAKAHAKERKGWKRWRLEIEREGRKEKERAMKRSRW